MKALLEDLIGAPVIGYRAPTYSITRRAPWAHAILAEEGFRYSSSIFPIVHDRYGIPDYSRFPVKLEIARRALWEFPLTTVRIAGKNLPVAGGGYLRLFPVWTVAEALERVNNAREPAGDLVSAPVGDRSGDPEVFAGLVAGHARLHRAGRHARQARLPHRALSVLHGARGAGALIGKMNDVHPEQRSDICF